MGTGTGFGKTILIGDQFVLRGVPAIVASLPFVTECTVERMAAGEGDLVREVSMIKAYCGELVNDVMYDCLQFHGGMGYVEEYPMARYFRDAPTYTMVEGSANICKWIIALDQLGIRKANR